MLPLTSANADIYRFVEMAYLMLPAYLANMAPPFVKYWRGWNRPIYAQWLGDHKTVMGFALGVGAGIGTAFLQSRLVDAQGLFPYDDWFWFGVAMGLAAMMGDTVKSFYKRRLSIAPGQPWIPADQLDFVLAGLAALSFWVPLTWTDVLWIVVLSFIGDVLVNHASFYLGIRETKW